MYEVPRSRSQIAGSLGVEVEGATGPARFNTIIFFSSQGLHGALQSTWVLPYLNIYVVPRFNLDSLPCPYC